MRTILALAVIFSTLLPAHAAVELERNPDGSLKRFTKAEFMKKSPEYRREFANEIMRITNGGKVVKPNSGRGVFVFINGTKIISLKDVESVLTPIKKYAMINVRISDGENIPPTGAPAALKTIGANAGVFLVESDILPRLLVAPEEGWAMVNVRALASDKALPGILVARVRKEMVRAFTYVCGSASDARNVATMGPVAQLSDLDSIPSDFFSPANAKQMGQQLHLFGIDPIVSATYKKACQEGWAPPPADKYQKAIWEQSKAEKERGPSNPLQIKP